MSTKDPAEAYAAVLSRSVSPLDVVIGASRLTSEDEQEVAEATSVSSSIAFVVANAGSASQTIIKTLATCMTSFFFDPTHLQATLAITNLSPAQRASAVDWIVGWRFNRDLEAEPIPDKAPPDTLCIVRAEDVVMDILLRPLQLLQKYISRALATWQPLIGKKVQTFPTIRTWDPSLAVIEDQILQALGIHTLDPDRPLQNVRFDARTIAGAVTVPTDARLDFASQHTLDISKAVAAGHLVRTNFNSLSPINNLEPFRDEVFTPVPTELVGADADAIVDPFYGQVYRAGIFTAQPGVYGLGSLLNPLFEPAFSNAGYLRVPFRAICRHYAHDRADLELAIAHVLQTIKDFGGHHVVFRGQTKEYTLGRSSDLLEHLYGRPDAVEPSLLSSAERRTLKYAGWQALWSSIVEDHAVSVGLYPKQTEEVSSFGEVQGDLIKLSLAQHYGLPTPALDVTRSWKVAIWFALNNLGSGSPGRYVAQPQGEDEISVVYVMVTDSRHTFSGELGDYPAARPSRQRGLFMPTAWGLARNRTARQIVAALYFRGRMAQEFDDLPSWQYLFPDESEDALMGTAAKFRDASPGNKSVQELYNSLYSLE